MVLLLSRLRFRFSGLPRQAPWFFLKSEPGPVAVVSARPGGGTRGGSRATNLKVKADDSGGSGVLARRDRARPDLAFSLPLTGEGPKSLKSDPRRMPEPVHDAVCQAGSSLRSALGNLNTTHEQPDAILSCQSYGPYAPCPDIPPTRVNLRERPESGSLTSGPHTKDNLKGT